MLNGGVRYLGCLPLVIGRSGKGQRRLDLYLRSSSSAWCATSVRYLAIRRWGKGYRRLDLYLNSSTSAIHMVFVGLL
jgi:hypothetical protein